MPECLSVKVSWIVMVATDEKKPVVGFIYSLGIALDNILIHYCPRKSVNILESDIL